MRAFLRDLLGNDLSVNVTGVFVTGPEFDDALLRPLKDFHGSGRRGSHSPISATPG